MEQAVRHRPAVGGAGMFYRRDNPGDRSKYSFVSKAADRKKI